MTRDKLAEELNGMEYRECIPASLLAQAKLAGLLIIFGHSDDLLEFEGAFRDEVGAYGGTTAMIDKEGVLPDWDDFRQGEEDIDAFAQYFNRKPGAKEVKAIWHDGEGEYAWTIETDLPYACFDIVEGGAKFSQGIVVNLNVATL